MKKIDWRVKTTLIGVALFYVALAVLLVMCLTGCGHNIGTAFSGKMVNFGYDPELNKFGIQYYDGVFVSGLNKEKTETHLTFTDSAESESRLKTSSSMMYRHRTGDQVTGYVVDLERAKRE